MFNPNRLVNETMFDFELSCIDLIADSRNHFFNI